MDRDLDVVAMSLVYDCRDLLVGAGLYIAQEESAILIISTPRLHCLRVSRMNSSRVLHNTPAASFGLPS
jgi:hypothetical protein